MKILFVAIPNHHFFQWVNQLEGSGYEVYWFDITDGSDFVQRISWVSQLRGWKNRFDYPFRHGIKKRFPAVYKFIQNLNERSVTTEFEKALIKIKPDVVHCFEMRLSGIPILKTIQKYPEIPLVYSSWGSDLFSFQNLGVSKNDLELFLRRANFLITDCQRDFVIAQKHQFSNQYLGVFPGNGGILIPNHAIKKQEGRELIMVKGYDDQFGKALKIIQALEKVDSSLLISYKIVVYSADKIITDTIKDSDFFKKIKYEVYERGGFLENQLLLELMGNSVIHIANSISDGMPNALLEAMGMGAFPIQSNPGNVTEEVIANNDNGFLIQNPYDSDEIAKHIQLALESHDLRKKAQDFNTSFICSNYDRKLLHDKIVAIYPEILSQNPRP